MNLSRLGRSFRNAGRGLAGLWRREQNFRIHVLAALVALFLAFYLKISAWQLLALIFIILVVLVLEMINTAFERLVDMYKPRLHEYVGEIKDIMSAMVLVAAAASIAVALIIFLPYFIN